MSNFSLILYIVSKIHRHLSDTLCSELVINAGQHNYFEMFTLAFLIQFKKTLFNQY